MRSSVCVLALVLALAAVQAQQTVPSLTPAEAASRVQQARINLNTAKTNLGQLRDQVVALRNARDKAHSDFKAALDDYKAKVVTKTAADNIVAAAKTVADARLTDLNTAKAKQKAAQDLFDARNKEKASKEDNLARTQKSLGLVDAMPNPIVPDSKTDLQQYKKQLEQWMQEYDKIKADLDSANSLAKSAQGSYDAASADLATKKQAASDANTAVTVAKDKSNSLSAILTAARNSLAAGRKSYSAGRDAVLKARQDLQAALQAQVSATQSRHAQATNEVEAQNRRVKIAQDNKDQMTKRVEKLTGQLSAVSSELKETQQQLARAEVELTEAKKHFDHTTLRVNHKRAKLQAAEQEAANFKNPGGEAPKKQPQAPAQQPSAQQPPVPQKPVINGTPAK